MPGARLTEVQFAQLPESARASIRSQIAGGCIGRANVRRCRQMNGAERVYSEHLEQRRIAGEILHYAFEAVTFRLADDCRYTPDFLVIGVTGIEFHETKAYWRKAGKVGWHEDAKVKVRVAAGRYPWFRFMVVYNKSGNWIREEF